MPHLLPTELIIAQLRRGDDVDAITRHLYQTYERPVKGYIRKQGGSPDDAEDIMQEVMIVFLRQVLAGKFEHRDDADLGSYLIGIARRKWLKTVESESRRRERQFRFVMGSHAPETPEEVVTDEDYRAWAWTYFQQLGEACRQILTAFYQEEQSLEAIAAQYDLGTVGAVKMRKFRCMQKLLNIAST